MEKNWYRRAKRIVAAFSGKITGVQINNSGGPPVAPVYKSPFVFTGQLNKVIAEHLSKP